MEKITIDLDVYIEDMESYFKNDDGSYKMWSEELQLTRIGRGHYIEGKWIEEE